MNVDVTANKKEEVLVGTNWPNFLTLFNNKLIAYKDMTLNKITEFYRVV
jgi:hypothetical protein